MERRVIKLLTVLLLLTGALVTLGWIGFMMLGLPSPQALSSTINIISSVGLGSPPVESAMGWTLIGILQFGSIGIVTVTVALLSQVIIQGALKQYMGRKRMDERIKHLSNHSIIVGYSLTGAALVRDLKAEGQDFVVIESNPETITKLDEMGILFVEGDGLDDETLRNAGIERARAIFAVLSADSDNLMVVLSARGLNEKMNIVSRVTREDYVDRFHRAGVDAAISPQEWASRRMVQSVLRPHLLDLLSSLLDPSVEHAYLDEVRVPPKSSAINKTLADSGIRQATGIVILGIATLDGLCNSVVGPDTVLSEGDVLIGYGQRQDFSKLTGFLND